MSKRFEVEVLVKLKFFSGWEDDKVDEHLVELSEEGEIELMLDKDMRDCTYTDNQSCRFDEVEVIKIKARELKGEGVCEKI